MDIGAYVRGRAHDWGHRGGAGVAGGLGGGAFGECIDW